MKEIQFKGIPYYDVAIIGGGVVGALTAYYLSAYELKICVVEKEHDIAMGATGANSSIVHAGYDPAPGTLKAKFNVKGAHMMESLCKDLSVPYTNNGALVISFSEKENSVLYELMERGKKNAAFQSEIITRNEALKKEPNISPEIYSALHVPGSSIISPYELTFAAAETALLNGTDFFTEHEVTNIEKTDVSGENLFLICCRYADCDCETRKILCGKIINASGVSSGRISAMIGDYSHKIIPRKGEYIVFDKKLRGFINHTIFTTPGKEGKGVIVTSTVDGNILAGPNASHVKNPFDNTNTKKGIEKVKNECLKTVPGIDMNEIIRSFAGVRATPDTGDFIIGESTCENNFFQAGGIESPGLSAAPAIASYISDLVVEASGKKAVKKNKYLVERKKPVKFSDLTNSEKEKLLVSDSGYANVICRCEEITEAEIINAIRRPLGAKSINGIKMRTRAGMGRCQGGFCLPRIIKLLSGELNIPPTDVLFSGTGSEILRGTKR